MKVIARIYNDFNEKFGIPRQSGILEEMPSVIVFEKDYNNPDAIRGLDGYSHLWLIWGFSENEENNNLTVRPPRLGGNTRVGVFATRSPFRPNGLGLSSVRLKSIENTENGPILTVLGADLMNGTPIYDIKPYIAYTDSHPDAICGFADEKYKYSLIVDIPSDLMSEINPKDLSTILKILENDPRPSYQNDRNRVYKMSFGIYDISFTVNQDHLTVTEIVKNI